MNIFNEAIETHAQWKLVLKKNIEEGVTQDIKEVANCHVCDLGRWIYEEGIKYNRLPSFESMCYNHEHFHRAAAEVVHYGNTGDRHKALSLISQDGIFAQSSGKLVRALMECSKELAHSVIKGAENTGHIRCLLDHKGGNKVYSIESSASVMDALKMMVNHNIGALVVYRDKDFIGIFTERGYAQNIVLKGTTALEAPIADMIDAETFCVDPEDSVQQCMTLMTATHKRHLPVMEEGKVIGIISIGDVIKQVISEDSDKREQLEGYIHGHYGFAV